MNKKFILISICLAAAIVAVYWPVYKYDFVKYDDDAYVTDNKNIQSGYTWENLKWTFTTRQASNWHPLTWMSHTLDYRIFKWHAGGHHITNVLFHIANTILLFYFFKKVTSLLWPAFFVAAAFALHPLHVESVAWIAERKDVLSTFFWLLTMLAYMNYAKDLQIKWYSTTLTLFVLGLMSKPMLVTLPFVLLLLDYWPLERKLNKSLVVEKIPFFIFSFLSCVITYICQQKGGAVTGIAAYGFKNRVASIIISYAEYLWKMIWPAKLAVLYPYLAGSFPLIKFIISVLVLLLICVIVIWFGRRHKFLIFGWLWYLGTLVPVVGFVQVGAHTIADRYTYVPLTGIFLIIVFGARQLFQKHVKVLAVLGVAILIVWGVVAAGQVKYWKDSLTLFKHTLQVTKKNYIIMTNYAASLNDAGRYEDAITYSRELIEMRPNSPENHNSLGCSLLNVGKNDEAIDEFRLALKYKPDFPQAYYNLGIAVSEFNNFEKAVIFFQKAIDCKPDYIEAYVKLAATLNDLQRFAETVEACDKALRIAPENVFLHGYRGMALSGVGRIEEAIEEIKYVVNKRPNDVQMRRNLGILLEKKGLNAQAAQEYRKVLQSEPNNTNVQWLLNRCSKDANGK
ncbi:MAG: tetratricopeptide repeat protein [Planctomycetaceae bacterium]|nr:tetratricopeptide repeat protein [Planctomycetaceae bacterium]